MRNLLRALRLPFTSVSVLPFIFGSLLARPDFNIFRFFWGLIAVVSTHLSANLINDYADSKSGADWKDRNFYKFFGGSKLIQERILTEQFYRNLAISLALLAIFSVIVLGLVLKTASIFAFYALILLLGWSYSTKPLQFSYRRLGEVIIFILFGPALVMGAYFIQTANFPTLEGFILALPFGFLTTAILYANEIPDFFEDKDAAKLNWVSLLGPQKAFILYYLLMGLAFISIILGILGGYLSWLSFLSLLFILPALKAARILQEHFADKKKLVESSKLTIAVHTLVSIVLILDTLI